MEVQAIKIGKVIDRRGFDGDVFAPQIMLIEPSLIPDIEDIIVYYLSVLRNNVSDRYILMNHTLSHYDGIITQPSLNKSKERDRKLKILGI